MELMEEVARILAAHQCKTIIVAVSVYAINFHEIRKYYIVTILGHMNFRSSKSMEIDVLVINLEECYRIVSAFSTYMFLS